MLDGDIRSAVRDLLEQRHAETPDTRIRNELGLCLGQTRVDIAVINGAMSGYEIKSSRDTLARFPAQVEIYGRVLDHATVVAEGPFVTKVESFVPDWWGIWEAVEGDDGAEVFVVRPEACNPSADPLSVAQLLWRDEALEVLHERDAAAGMARATRWELWDRLAELPIDELGSIVRHKLKGRTDWPGG